MIGTVTDWRLTRSGYQITTIDGTAYATTFDFAKLPIKVGCRVEFTTGPAPAIYPGCPSADILRVLGGES